MSSRDLKQAPVTFCNAGASWLLPTSPTCWKPRETFQPTFVKNLNDLAKLIIKHFPEKRAAIDYLQSWLSHPRLPLLPPPAFKFFDQKITWLRHGHAAIAVEPALKSAITANNSQIQCMGVKRRRSSGVASFASRITSVSLQTWVDFRESQGASADLAVAEWRGAKKTLQEEG